MPRQLSIQGTQPTHYNEIDEAGERVRQAKVALKQATDRVKAQYGTELATAEQALAELMLDRKVAVYEYTASGERVRLDVALPDPTVKVTFLGNEDDA